ncbi:4-hydroxy-tetrahydrodipicolinate reductase [Oceanispirochaeta crateris]|uniref:4-hydroxy-tetrahydrodipicolinate reductase n=1 Tax=Oceanispirochaeta crateris TaxID=2518645 RepID=A0A5C1QKT3_9SPIO|nr:4-hydroxy-tetrahydrodipicolinate reductase [Oceanispirochaeta crateris]QEN07938.1 4-hydroxy-tetrahydrodipicolinate reductase [Oceanispirochaeta crateris]
MKVIIMGYGRMGREIEKILQERGHQIISRVDPGGFGDELTPSEESLTAADAVIEFALPLGIEKNTALYSQFDLKAVIGTTGWTDRKETVLKPFENGKGACLYGSNFSIGAHLFFRLTEAASKMINKVEEYDIMLTEYHHNKKVDAPSGTALTAANLVLKNMDRKKEILPGNPQGAIKPEQLHVASIRGGHIPGIHTITMDSPADSLEISHNARNRSGFALGAVMAAEWLLKDKSGIYTVDDFISDLLD